MLFFLCITNNVIEYLIVLMIALLHEAGHLLVARFLHYPIKCVKIQLFGVNLEIGEEITDNLHIILICLAGPVVNVFLIIAGTALVKIGINVGSVFFYANFYMLFVNLLPVLPLDGGRIIKSLLFADVANKKTEKIYERISYVFILIIFLCGILFVLKSEHNFSLLIISMFLLDNIKPRSRQRDIASMYLSDITGGVTQSYYLCENMHLKDALKIVGFDDVKIIFILNNDGMIIGNITNKHILKLMSEGFGNSKISAVLKII